MMRALPLLASLSLLCAGCNMQKLTVDQTAEVFKRGMGAIEKEWDYELAVSTFPTNIKMLETFLYSAPENETMLFLLARIYSGYGMLGLEDQLERMPGDDELDENPARQALKRRTKEMHLRAHRYGLRLLEVREEGAKKAFAKGREELAKLLRGCDEDDVPALFWTAAPLAMALNVDREDISLMAELQKVKTILARVVELKGDYYYATAHTILGGFYGGVGPDLGGDPKLAREHFEKALKLTKRRFLLVQVMYAQTLAVQISDRKLFDSLLDEVDKAKVDILVEQRLANIGAKRRAARLRARAAELF